ncbi:MAG: hypothetical protein QN120_05195 [Armatimonadota bacterium]|nr:hypothetical protein [Armatimonadota bacterium]
MPGPVGRLLIRQLRAERNRRVAEWRRLYPGCRCGYPVRGTWWTDSLHRPVHTAWLVYLARSARTRRQRNRKSVEQWAHRALPVKRERAATYWIQVLSAHRPDLLAAAGGPEGLRALVLQYGARHGTGHKLIERIKTAIDDLADRGVIPKRRQLRHPPRWWLRTLRPPTWKTTKQLLAEQATGDQTGGTP